MAELQRRRGSGDAGQSGHGEQQHGEHRAGQEAGGAAEDGGQHRQDQGVQSGSRPDVLLRSSRQRGPAAVAGAGVGEPVQGEEVLLLHPVAPAPPAVRPSARSFERQSSKGAETFCWGGMKVAGLLFWTRTFREQTADLACMY
ncbi:hypothetical protein OJAV_G00218090 [Oryzias javanicus]|uniref:Uncharacterized protein n=1 Tax=Oryzias javanicus TaxID=123683 RepID=A0A437C4M0_ORYJA|nr:hypothetical protein OJAV_G00218090 [Oryzias javanicus]